MEYSRNKGIIPSKLIVLYRKEYRYYAVEQIVPPIIRWKEKKKKRKKYYLLYQTYDIIVINLSYIHTMSSHYDIIHKLYLSYSNFTIRKS